MSVSNKPIFVVGTPRSGTTLTAKILGLQSRIFMPGETHYLDDVLSRSDQLGDVREGSTISRIAERLYTIDGRYYEPEDQSRIEKLFPACTDLGEALRGSADFGEILDRFMRIQMEAESKQRWGNNAPRDLFGFRELKQFFPGAKFVICVRDVRAFLLSYKGKWKIVDEDFHVERLKNLYHPVVTSYLWKSSMKQLACLRNEISANDWVIVRYEELVTEPERTIRKVCEAIDEVFEPAMLDVDSHNSSCTDQEKGIFDTSVDRWLTELEPEEIAVGQYIAKNELSFLGYQNVDVSVHTGRLMYLWTGAPFALWKALCANRQMRGPLIPYLAKRVSVLFSKSG